jgi:hypothetical protein
MHWPPEQTTRSVAGRHIGPEKVRERKQDVPKPQNPSSLNAHGELMSWNAVKMSVVVCGSITMEHTRTTAHARSTERTGTDTGVDEWRSV